MAAEQPKGVAFVTGASSGIGYDLAGSVKPDAPAGKRGRVGGLHASPRKPEGPFRYFNSSPEVIQLVVMTYMRFPLSLRNVEDLLFERGTATRWCGCAGTGPARCWQVIHAGSG